MNAPDRLLFALAAFFIGGLTASADDLRWSKTLSTSEISDSGLLRISSDQVAILDALVRRDLAIVVRPSQPPRPANFSDRLTSDERKNSGLAMLSPDELAHVNQYVARLTEPATSPTGFSDGQSSRARITTMTLRRQPEIHGSISLMYGAGSGGYNEYGGAVTLSYEDPNGFALAVGYSEIRSNGGYYYRDWRDRSYGYGLGMPLR